MEQKVRNAFKMKTLKLLLFALIMLFSRSGYSQTKSISLLDKFHRSIERSIMYPTELIAACKPTYAFLKITINSRSECEKTQVSDNADKLLVAEVILQEKNFDKRSLETYLKENGIKDIELLIPLIYTIGENTCRTSYADIKDLIHLTDFLNVSVTNRSAMIMKPVGVVFNSNK